MGTITKIKERKVSEIRTDERTEKNTERNKSKVHRGDASQILCYSQHLVSHCAHNKD